MPTGTLKYPDITDFTGQEYTWPKMHKNSQPVLKISTMKTPYVGKAGW